MRKSNLYAVYTGLTIDVVNEEFINGLNLLYDVSTKVLLLDNNLICSNENFNISLSTEGIWDSITKFIKKNWNSFSKWVKDLWNKIFKSKEEIVKCEKDIANKASEMMAKGELKTKQEMDDIVANLHESINSKYNKMMNEIRDEAGKVYPGINAASNNVSNNLSGVSKKEIMQLLGSNKDKLFAGVLPTKNYIKATKSVDISYDVNILHEKMEKVWEIRSKLKDKLTKDQYEYLYLIANKMRAQYKTLEYLQELKLSAREEAKSYMADLSKIRGLKNKRLKQGYITDDKIKEEYVKEFNTLRKELKDSIYIYNSHYSNINSGLNKQIDELSEVILKMDKVFK